MKIEIIVLISDGVFGFVFLQISRFLRIYYLKFGSYKYVRFPSGPRYHIRPLLHSSRYAAFLSLFVLVLCDLGSIDAGWVLAWKLVLVHVPLVQEIFGLRKKPRKPKPRTGRLSRFYNNINARDPASGW